MPETIESDAYNLTFRWVASKEIRDIKPGFEIGPFWSTPVKKWGEKEKTVLNRAKTSLYASASKVQRFDSCSMVALMLFFLPQVIYIYIPAFASLCLEPPKHSKT